MKRIVFVFAVLLCLTAFVSCTKSGVYKPKVELSEIWFESESVRVIDSVERRSKIPKYLREDWMWDGKALNSRTVYTKDGDVKFNYIYEYNKKGRIVGITSNIPAEKKTRIRFIYDDDSKMLREIKYFTEDFPDTELPYRWLVFSYDGNKLMSITETINTTRFPRNSYVETSLLSYLVSEEMAASIEESSIRSKIEYDITSNVYEFEWEKKNISHITITSTAGGNTTEENISYTYDKNKNPQLARLTGLVEDASVNALICSHNNVVSCTYEGPTKTYTEECEYTYDKKIPVEKVVKRTEKISTVVSTITEKWTYVYEE